MTILMLIERAYRQSTQFSMLSNKCLHPTPGQHHRHPLVVVAPRHVIHETVVRQRECHVDGSQFLFPLTEGIGHRTIPADRRRFHRRPLHVLGTIVIIALIVGCADSHGLPFIIKHLATYRPVDTKGCQFKGFLYLDRPNDRGDDRGRRSRACAFHPSDRARTGHPSGQVFQSFGSEITGVAVPARSKHTGRSLQPVDATVHPRDTCPHTEPVDAESRPPAVDTADNDIHLPYQCQADIISHIATHRSDIHGRVHLSESLGHHLHFPAPLLGIGPGEEDGTGEVSRLHDIEIDSHNMYDAHQHQVLQHLVSQGTAAHHHHTGGTHLILSELYHLFLIVMDTSTRSFPITRISFSA